MFDSNVRTQSILGCAQIAGGFAEAAQFGGSAFQSGEPLAVQCDRAFEIAPAQNLHQFARLSFRNLVGIDAFASGPSKNLGLRALKHPGELAWLLLDIWRCLRAAENLW